MLGAELIQSGLRVEVLEEHHISSGASGLCSGTATLQQYGSFSRIRQIHGIHAAKDYSLLLRRQMNRLTRLHGNLTRLCETDCYTYAFLTRDLPGLEAHLKLYEALGIPCRTAPDAGGCPFPVELSIVTEKQLTVDVPQLLMGLAQQIRQGGGHIRENTRVLHAEARRVHTAQATIEAPFVILCTGMPLGLRQHRLLALLETHTLVSCRLESQVPLHTCQQSVRADGLSLRPCASGAYAAWDLGRVGMRATDERAALLDRVLSCRMADWTVQETQTRQEVWSLDGLPVIGELAGEGLLCATGYSGWGLLGAAVAAEVLARRILGRREAQDALFSPARALPERVMRRLSRNLTAIRRRSQRHYLTPRCPHMGCRMRYSIEAEQWGCPYCGSVFSMLGQRLSGPSMRSARVSPLRRPFK